MNDPQKGPQAKKSKAAYLKSKADAEGLLAKKLGVMDMIEPAVKDYREIAESAETPADKVKYQLSAAEVYFDGGKPEEAVTAYTSIIEANPDNLDAIYKLGLAYASVAKFQESANTFQKFLDKAPETDARVPEVKAVLKDLIVGNNLQPPKSEPSRAGRPRGRNRNFSTHVKMAQSRSRAGLYQTTESPQVNAACGLSATEIIIESARSDCDCIYGRTRRVSTASGVG